MKVNSSVLDNSRNTANPRRETKLKQCGLIDHRQSEIRLFFGYVGVNWKPLSASLVVKNKLQHKLAAVEGAEAAAFGQCVVSAPLWFVGQRNLRQTPFSVHCREFYSPSSSHKNPSRAQRRFQKDQKNKKR